MIFGVSIVGFVLALLGSHLRHSHILDVLWAGVESAVHEPRSSSDPPQHRSSALE